MRSTARRWWRSSFGGKQPVAHSNVNPLDWVYSEDVPAYPYDPAKAAGLLDAAGWSEMRDGVRHNAAASALRSSS